MHGGLATRLDLAHGEDGSLRRASWESIFEGGNSPSIVYRDGWPSVKDCEAAELGAERIEGLRVGILDEDRFARGVMSCSDETRNERILSHDECLIRWKSYEVITQGANGVSDGWKMKCC